MDSRAAAFYRVLARCKLTGATKEFHLVSNGFRSKNMGIEWNQRKRYSGPRQNVGETPLNIPTLVTPDQKIPSGIIANTPLIWPIAE